MPKLSFKAVEIEDVRSISGPLMDDLQALLDVPRQNLFIEVSRSVFVRDGEVETAVPVVEVEWLPRDKGLQDQAADIITKHLASAGYHTVDLIFTMLDLERFYRMRP